MQITTRKALKDELSIGLNLLKEAGQWLRDKNIDYRQNWLSPSEVYINRVKEGFYNGQFYFVENENGEIIGMYRLQLEYKMFRGEKNDKAGYIHSFTTDRKLAGQGIGKIIMKKVEDDLMKKGINLLRLDCGSNIIDLCKYYEDNGFKCVGEVNVLDNRLSLYEKCLGNI